jgi:hypothetical protein
MWGVLKSVLFIRLGFDVNDGVFFPIIFALVPGLSMAFVYRVNNVPYHEYSIGRSRQIGRYRHNLRKILRQNKKRLWRNAHCPHGKLPGVSPPAAVASHKCDNHEQVLHHYRTQAAGAMQGDRHCPRPSGFPEL